MRKQLGRPYQWFQAQGNCIKWLPLHLEVWCIEMSAACGRKAKGALARGSHSNSTYTGRVELS